MKGLWERFMLNELKPLPVQRRDVQPKRKTYHPGLILVNQSDLFHFSRAKLSSTGPLCVQPISAASGAGRGAVRGGGDGRPRGGAATPPRATTPPSGAPIGPGVRTGGGGRRPRTPQAWAEGPWEQLVP